MIATAGKKASARPAPTAGKPDRGEASVTASVPLNCARIGLLFLGFRFSAIAVSSFFCPGTPVFHSPNGNIVIGSRLNSDRLLLRPLEPEDAPKLLQYVLENREWLMPWEPIHPPAYFTLEGQHRILEQCMEDRREQTGVMLGIFERNAANGRIQGRISVSGIVRGIWQNGFLGYSIAAARADRGYMTEAVRRVVLYGFANLALHRLQASIIPRNEASKKVLEKSKFRYEGRALRYLKINDVWEDHDIFAITADEIRAGY